MRCEITCEKTGISSTEPAHWLEILQWIAFSKPKLEHNKSLILPKSTKIKSVGNYLKKKIQNQGAAGHVFQNSSFQFGGDQKYYT